MTPRLVAISDRKAWPMESASGKGWNSPKTGEKMASSTGGLS